MSAGFRVLGGVFVVLFNCFAAYAGQESFPAWKSKLENKGLDFEASYKVDYFANTKGAIKKDETYVSMSEIILQADTQKAGLWSGGNFFVHLIETSGGKKISSDIVGDLQGVSNIAAPRTARVFELWYEQTILENKLFLLLGIEDLNSEFYVSKYGGLYINSSFGIGPEVAGGRPSVFPLAAPGIRLKFLPNERWEFLTAVYDGDPGDADEDENFPRSDFDKKGGAFLISEAGYHFGGQQTQDALPGFIKIGFWHNTGEFTDLVDGDDLDASGDISEEELFVRDGNTGGYLVADKMLFRE